MGLSSALAWGDAAHPHPEGDVYLWVCARQSNMAGYGPLRRRERPDPGLAVFNMDGTWIPAVEPITRIFASLAPAIRDSLVKAFGPAGCDNMISQQKKKSFGGVGPALSFAKQIRKRTWRGIGLVPCALTSGGGECTAADCFRSSRDNPRPGVQSDVGLVILRSRSGTRGGARAGVVQPLVERIEGLRLPMLY